MNLVPDMCFVILECPNVVFKNKSSKINILMVICKKMGDFIEPGTHRGTNIKVKIETVEKKIRNVF